MENESKRRRRCKICLSPHRREYEKWYANTSITYRMMSHYASNEWDTVNDKPKYGEEISHEAFRRHFYMHYLPELLGIEEEFEKFRRLMYPLCKSGKRDITRYMAIYLYKRHRTTIKERMKTLPDDEARIYFNILRRIDREFDRLMREVAEQLAKQQRQKLSQLGDS
ncbi:MAG: hypothetical protein N0A00_10095 [Candidatus Bathyarchaeota archaeon]|nr:hypothetical protein [Candidatus Bathyarchaeota archaeon]